MSRIMKSAAGGLALALAVASLLPGCKTESETESPGSDDAGLSVPDASPDDLDRDGVKTPEDCDDRNARVRPGQHEICGDAVDQDCDGYDPPCDDDRDGFNEDEGDCDDTQWSVRPEALETCGDGIDQDCNGADLRCDEIDNDGDGWSAAAGDCDDTKLYIYPGAPDRCGDGHDDDCDGVDPLCPDNDRDSDGVADDVDLCPSLADPFQSDLDADGVGDFCDNCLQVQNADQADGDQNGLGDACDGAVDQDLDGFTGAMGDCNDEAPTVNPEAMDTCDDGVDQNCNGFPDDGCASDIRSRLIAVPAGESRLGSEDAVPADCAGDPSMRDENCDEIPRRTVRLSAFEVEVTEVTNKQYKACVDFGRCGEPYTSPNLPASRHYADPAFAQHPVVFVSQGQAATYCAFAGRRLPTEVEWERAARGSLPLEPQRYPWGDAVPDCMRANLGRCRETTEPVGTRAGDTNGLGIKDLGGNIKEITSGFYAENWYGTFQDGAQDPQPPQMRGERDVISIRGGAYETQPEFATLTYRGFGVLMGSRDRRPEVGFRCVR